MNNDKKDFGKMDLNFDPTVEAQVNLNEEPKPVTSTPVTPQPTQQPVQQQTQTSFSQNESRVDENVMASIDPQPKSQPTILNESDIKPNTTTNIDHSQPMDKTLEFIIQNDPVKTDLTIDEKKEAKQAEKKARKHRRISFIWIFIAVLSILYGIDSLWTFASNINELIGHIKEDASIWKITTDVFVALIHSFEAVLFGFFIAFSAMKYKANHKPWIKWWDDTEPLRVAAEIKKEKEKYTKHIERVNALSLYYTPVNKESHSDHELLSNLKAENKVLAGMISNEESRRKDAAKAKKNNN